MTGVLLFLFAASIPLTDVSRHYLGAGSLPELLLVLLAIAWMRNLKRSGFRLTTGLTFLYCVLILAVWSWWVAAARAPQNDPAITAEALVREVEYFVAALVISQLAIGLAHRRTLTHGSLAGLVIALIFAATQWVAGPAYELFHNWGPPWAGVYTESSFRVWGSFGHPLTLVNYLSALLGLLTVFAIRESRSKRQLLWVCLLLFAVLGLISTGSRTALVVMLIPAVYGIGSVPGRAIKRTAIIGGVLLVTVAATNVATVAFDRLADLGADDLSVVQRVLVYESALRMISDYPVFGVGPGKFGEAYFPDYLEENASLDPSTFTPENMLLLTGAELGIPAMLVFAAGLFVMIRRGFEMRLSMSSTVDRVHSEAFALGTTCLVAASMTQASSDAASRLLLYTLLGLLLALQGARVPGRNAIQGMNPPVKVTA